MTLDVPQGLLARARDDAEAVRATLSVTGVSDAIVGFHAQQAVEKSFKAVLANADIKFPFTHDLEGLIEHCTSHELEIPSCSAITLGF
jgi:HEPN domain-containing protein